MRFKHFSLLIILFALQACSGDQASERTRQFALFDSGLYHALATTYEVEQIATELIGNESPITRPPLTWVELMRFQALDSGPNKNGGSRSMCLFYMVPMQVEKIFYRGILKLAEVAPDEDCRGKFVRPALVEIDELEELTVYLEHVNRDLPKENYQILPYTLTMKIKHQGKTFWAEYPLLNVSPKNFVVGGNVPLVTAHTHQLNSGAIADTAIPGVQVLPINQLYFTHKKLPAMDFSGESKFCHQVTDSCLGVANECERCEFGFFEGVSRRCKNGGVKFCAPLKCGDHGQPACVRGYSYVAGMPLEGCYNDSASGFCKPGLKLVCDDNKVLICL